MTTLLEKTNSSRGNTGNPVQTVKPGARQSSAYVRKYGPWALVTGASSGIGEEFARQLAARGLNLILVSRRESRLQQLAEELSDRHAIQTRVVAADLTRDDALEAVSEVADELEVGLLVNNAGIENHGALTAQSLAAEARLVELNVLAPLKLAHHFGARMQARGRGGIIFVSSAGGYGAWPYLANYAASKAYVLTLGESLHYELARHGVDVTVLSPGLTETAMADNIGASVDFSKFPMKTMQPEDVVQTGLDALGRKASVVPGRWNNVLAFAIKRILSRRGVMKMFGRLMEKAAVRTLV